ncbi:hypothetical protein HYW59_01415 [Candidatus Kaiserbacteria bacterium]|nr:hypothetical protein [Candidatus Kaiserbacteria bacterium]
MESGLASVVLWVMSLAAAIVSAVLGTILAYHWFNFGSNRTVSLFALILYAGGCGALLVGLVALAAAV